LENSWIFINKNRDTLNTKHFQKSVVYYFFFIFLAFLVFFFLFHLSKLLQKLWSFLNYFIGRVRDFANVFWKIQKVLLKKIMIREILFFSKFYVLLFAFLFFCYFWHFIFKFFYFFLLKTSRNFYVFLFYGLEILSKKFGKSWNIFQKVYLWNPKFFINSTSYYLFFLFF